MGDGKVRMREPAPFLATTERCYGCVTAREQFESIDEDDRDGVHVHLIPNPEAN